MEKELVCQGEINILIALSFGKSIMIVSRYNLFNNNNNVDSKQTVIIREGTVVLIEAAFALNTF